jgi:hypothetical protein
LIVTNSAIEDLRLFDAVGFLATAGLAGTLLKSVADTASELYRLERV